MDSLHNNTYEENTKLGIYYAIISAVLGSLATITYKPMMNSGIPPLTIGMLEALAIVVFLFIPCKPWKILSYSSEIKKLLAITSILQAVGVTSFFVGLSYLNPVTFTFLVKNQVVFTVLIGYILLSERHNFPTWLFIVSAVVGSGLLLFDDFEVTDMRGVWYALACCCAYSIKNYYMRRYKQIPNLTSIFFCYVCTFIVMFGFSKYHSIEFIQPNITTTIRILFTGVFVVAGTIYFYQLALKHESVSLVTSIRLFSPFLVTLYFATIGGVYLGGYKLLGIITIAIASIVLFVDKNRDLFITAESELDNT